MGGHFNSDHMTETRIERDALCPCGSGDPYKNCHEPTYRRPTAHVGSYPVQPRLDQLAHAAIDALAAIAPRKFNVSVGEDRYSQECVTVFFAAMLHSAASAILTLIEHGLVREAFGLRRKIMSATVGMQYYSAFPTEATMFAASQPLKRYRTLSAHSGLPASELADLRAEVDTVLKIHPTVGEWKPDGSLKQTWNEKSDSEKRDALFPSLDPKERATMKLILEDLSSQDLHGTAFAIGNAIELKAQGGDITLTIDRAYARGNYLIRETALAVLLCIDSLILFREGKTPALVDDIRRGIDLFRPNDDLFFD